MIACERFPMRKPTVSFEKFHDNEKPRKAIAAMRAGIENWLYNAMRFPTVNPETL